MRNEPRSAVYLLFHVLFESGLLACFLALSTLWALQAGHEGATQGSREFAKS
jgi:hypothetical protein